MHLSTVLLTLICASGLTGCCARTQPRMLHTRHDCLPELEPSTPKDFGVSGDGDGCPKKFAGCLTRPSMQSLVIYVGALKSWVAEAKLRCGEAGPSIEVNN